MTTPEKTLQSTFGHQRFRPGQQEIISALLAKKSVLAILPTGAGKSLCYQVPGVMMDGTTLIISPLISLMQDQVASLLKRNIAAAYLSSTQTDIQRQQVLYQLQQGRLKFLYVAPERLQSNSFQDTIKAVPISFLVVDEAHCISTWGHQFRPSYRLISTFMKKLPQRV
ncbi:DEAD/DEAH box helicase, partial [Candidatus Woesebacteria bacterium]|nr:DEAD/DEAH box helicase [Candidatus Woesebacteria bacterium]